MTIYRGSDGGDAFIVVTQDEFPIDDPPVAKVIRLRRRQHETRLKICREIITDLTEIADRLGHAIIAVASTRIWRELAGNDLPPEPMKPKIQSYWETRDPLIRHALRLLHQVGTTVSALKSIEDKEPPGA